MREIQHVAIIMDGNGRWANSRHHQRIWGHIRGASVVSTIVEKASDMKLKQLTLFAFSTENWVRPEKEVKTLFLLLHKFVTKERDRILKNNIRFSTLGGLEKLPDFIKKKVVELEEDSKSMTGLGLTIAFDYGGRQEIVNAAQVLIDKKLPVTIENFENQLQSRDIGNVDLLIRTGGVLRLSNFLLWSCAYAEFYFTPTPWPDFKASDFEMICDEINKRERRFGDTTNSGPYEEVAAKASQQRDRFVW